MRNQWVKRLSDNVGGGISIRLLRRHEGPQKFSVHRVLGRCRSCCSKADNEAFKEVKEASSQVPLRPKRDEGLLGYDSHSSEDDLVSHKWKPELAWLSKALEPAMQLCRWALPTGNGVGDKPPPTSRSIAEIFASIQRSKVGLQDWSLGDLTIGLYLIYLRQASTSSVADIKGELISSEPIVQDLIYHTELAKGAYKDNSAGLARHTMLRENNIVKFVKNSSVLRPGYYVGVDMRKRLVILGIRGTHTVYDLITDIVSSSNGEVTFEGYSTHFGTAEAARWFLTHEMETIRKCLDKHKGFRLRLVGHSLGGATASLLAIMLHKKSAKELGFNPDIVSAVGYATPPCVSKELSESCSDYVTTVVMQDDIIPRLSLASLTRLRNEILQTDWVSVLEKEDRKGVVDLVTNAKLVVSSVQDVARKVADYTKLRGQAKFHDTAIEKETRIDHNAPPSSNPGGSAVFARKEESPPAPITEELYVPGTLYYLKRDVETQSNVKRGDVFTLWKRHPGEHFERILLSSNFISDHKCDSHYYALRDVLKGLPVSHDECSSK